jgi:hypothetical protein
MQGREGQTAFRLPEQGHRLLWLGRHRVCSRVMQASVGLTAPHTPSHFSGLWTWTESDHGLPGASTWQAGDGAMFPSVSVSVSLSVKHARTPCSPSFLDNPVF